jgi:hypothetical protein
MTSTHSDPQERYFNQVNLSTGEACRSYRDEVSDAQVESVHELLREALSQPQARVAIQSSEYQRSTSASEKALAVSVWGPERGQTSAQTALVTFGVALDSRSSNELWRLLHTTARHLRTDIDSPPQLPWVGIRKESGITLTPTQVEWLQDFERCVAWAWIERAGQ